MSPVMSRRAHEANPFRVMVSGGQAGKMITQGTSVIKLSLGEPDFGAPPAVRDATYEQYDGRVLPYIAAMGLPELCQTIADFYRERHDLDIDPKHIYVIASGLVVLLLATALIVDSGDDVVVADSSYPRNREPVRSFEGRAIDVPTSTATCFHLTADLCSQYWTSRTKAVTITSPSNPTGTTTDFNVLNEVCKLAASYGAWRTVDGTYLDLADWEPDGIEVRSVLARDPDAIVCNSFSKLFSMTDWCFNWATLPDESTVLEAVDDLATNYYLYAHTPTQHAAFACFTSESLAECEVRCQESLTRRRIVIDGLERIGLPAEVEPNGAFYVYLDISRTSLDAWTFYERALDEAHMALTPGRDLSVATADTHVRLSYATSRGAPTEGLERLGTFVESL